MWSGRSSSSDGIRFCYGAVPFSEEIAPGAWTLELSAHGLSDIVQLLPQRCIRTDAILVWMITLIVYIVSLVSEYNITRMNSTAFSAVLVDISLLV